MSHRKAISADVRWCPLVPLNWAFTDSACRAVPMDNCPLRGVISEDPLEVFQNIVCFTGTETVPFVKHTESPELAWKENLSVSNKRLPSETRMTRDVERVLAQSVPPGWSLETQPDAPANGRRIDLLAEVTSPDGETARFAIEVKRLLEPRSAEATAEQILMLTATTMPEATPVVAAGYLSARTRSLLNDLGVGYIDTTGNISIASSTPGMVVFTQGADNDPWPQDAGLQSLRGRGAARAIRAIIDATPPFGTRELAGTTSASAPTLSRVLDLLEREAIVTRRPRGPVLTVDWEAAIRRWAEDYDQTNSNTATTFLDPRGIPSIEKKLQATKFGYAATGAFAAQRFNPIAPARTATIYVDDVTATADRLGLRETEAGANVVLLEPFDPVVFERTTTRDGLRCVAASQLAVDLLTGPGREPSQGEEILGWMKENEDAWRT